MTQATNYDQVLVALRRVIRATDLHSKRLSKHAGLTGPQLLIMRAIRELGEVTIGTIAENVSLSQATVTTILDAWNTANWSTGYAAPVTSARYTPI